MKKDGLRTSSRLKKSQDVQLLITIITVVYNNQQTLERTIKSVLSQSYENIEYIIIDGGSTDGTLEIIKKYEQNIDYWVSEPDEGLYDAMNKGIEAASGELIGIINSDDWYNENAIEKVVNEYIRTGADVFYGNMYKVNKDTGKKKLVQGNANSKDLNNSRLNHPTIFVKRDLYESYGKFDESLLVCADRDLILRFLDRHISFQKIDEVLAYFTLGGITSQRKLKTNWLWILQEYEVFNRHEIPFFNKWKRLVIDFSRLYRDWFINLIRLKFNMK